MATNHKQSSPQVASLAAQTLRDPKASALQHQLAGSVMAQARTGKQTGADMERVASTALRNPRSSEVTQTLAASLVSQSNRQR